jgi:hypothetical protein
MIMIMITIIIVRIVIILHGVRVTIGISRVPRGRHGRGCRRTVFWQLEFTSMLIGLRFDIRRGRRTVIASIVATLPAKGNLARDCRRRRS